MFHTTDRATRRRQREYKRARRAEERAFVSVYDRQKKNRTSQILLALCIGATFVGTSLSAVGSLVGFIMVIVAVPLLVGTGVWILRRWDY